MVGVFAAWISVNYPRAWYGSRWFVGALGVVILFVTYASPVADHRSSFRMERRFLFRANIRSLSRSLPVFPGGGEVHASEVNQFIRSKHGSYVFAIRRCYRDQCAAISLL